MKILPMVASCAVLIAASATSADATTLVLGTNGGSQVLDLGGADAGLVSPGAVNANPDAALPLGGSGEFIAAEPGAPVTLDLSSFAKISSLAFIWGSADAASGYNDLTVLGKDGSTLLTYTGAQVLALAGGTVSGSQSDPLSNPWVTLKFGADQTNVGKLVFNSNAIAFEASNFTLALPEAGTWAMMIVGVGLAGGALRRRNKMTLRYS